MVHSQWSIAFSVWRVLQVPAAAVHHCHRPFIRNTLTAGPRYGLWTIGHGPHTLCEKQIFV